MKGNRLLLILLIALTLVFGVGVARLFQLRFESGDVYPPYSSLRADPLGTRVFYDALGDLSGRTTRRFTQRLDKLGEGQSTTLFVFGTDAGQAEDSTEDEYKTLEDFMSEGGRIVVSLSPLNTKPGEIRRKEAGAGKKTDDKQPDNKGGKSDEPDDEARAGAKRISLKDRWNVSFGYEDLPKDTSGGYKSVVARRDSDLDLPESLIWHTALYFEPSGTNWNVIYVRDGHPVIIERRFGRGSVVLSADSYLVSNEAMRQARQPQLLAWLAGPNTRVLFDETHLGVMDEPGVAALIRKYRLHALVGGLILLAALFIWKNVVSFVPPDADEAGEDLSHEVTGRDSAAGFVNLLRRGIASSEILSVCFVEWKKSGMPGRMTASARMDRVAGVIAEEQSLPPRERNPVECYRRISRILSEHSAFSASNPASGTSSS